MSAIRLSAKERSVLLPVLRAEGISWAESFANEREPWQDKLASLADRLAREVEHASVLRVVSDADEDVSTFTLLRHPLQAACGQDFYEGVTSEDAERLQGAGVLAGVMHRAGPPPPLGVIEATTRRLTSKDQESVEDVLDAVEWERREAEGRGADELAACLRAAADDIAGKCGRFDHLVAERARDEHFAAQFRDEPRGRDGRSDQLA